MIGTFAHTECGQPGQKDIYLSVKKRLLHKEAWLYNRVNPKRRWLMEKGNEVKKVWETPEVVVYGDIDSLTQQTKLKQPGSWDDFGVTGISDP